MNTNKIKIGDWVWYNDGVPCKIQEVYQDGVAISPSKIKVSYDDIEPIPLTKEIFEKNGWELKEGEYTKNCSICNGLYLIPMIHSSVSILKSWSVSVGDDYIYTIHYVHELQHLLWALRENDNLTI